MWLLEVVLRDFSVADEMLEFAFFLPAPVLLPVAAPLLAEGCCLMAVVVSEMLLALLIVKIGSWLLESF